MKNTTDKETLMLLNNIKALRERYKLTKKEMAKRLGLSGLAEIFLVIFYSFGNDL